jgi:hypothetical protein
MMASSCMATSSVPLSGRRWADPEWCWQKLYNLGAANSFASLWSAGRREFMIGWATIQWSQLGKVSMPVKSDETATRSLTVSSERVVLLLWHSSFEGAQFLDKASPL